MPIWYYDKKELRQTPSILAGLNPEVELRYRREGARFAIDLGASMNLSATTIATGVIYFHRFYMLHNFQNFPRFPTASACLFLAGKVEETPKKCKDVIKCAQNLLPESKFAQFGDDPRAQLEEIMTLERILLQTIKFDLQVEHPYTFLLKYAKCLKGDRTKLQKMVQMAWTFVNDSLCTTLCLQWEPEIIAIALMYLAGKLSKFEVHDWNGRTCAHLRWWDVFVDDMSIELLEDICHQVLDLYTTPEDTPHEDSPPPEPRLGVDQTDLATGPSSPVRPEPGQAENSTPVAPSPVPLTISAQSLLNFGSQYHHQQVQMPFHPSRFSTPPAASGPLPYSPGSDIYPQSLP